MRFKNEITPQSLIVLASVYLIGGLNAPFWRGLFTAVEPSGTYEWLFLAAVFVVIVAVYALALTIFSLPYVLKPLIAALIMVAAALHYFTAEYGVVIDINMMRNTIATNRTEAIDLVTARLLLSLALFGVLPALFIWQMRVDWPPFSSLVYRNLKFAGIAAVIMAVATAPFLMNFTSVTREHRALLLKLAPANAVVATIRLATQKDPVASKVVAAYGEDATKRSRWTKRTKPVVAVMVVGETARADHFSLNGYERGTNAQLEQIAAVMSFTQVSSCGTDTAHSVPCIFSGLRRPEFSIEKAAAKENLLDIVQRAGLSVLWRENQSGCKGVCNRVPTESLTTAKLDVYCGDGECHDEILLDGLREKIDAMKNGGLIVLHMMGSHGPAYHKRYPAGFAKFKPACEESQFSRCTSDQIINSYDNTIAYTDVVLAKLIGLLTETANEKTDTAMIYVSDHGESLGEKGLYLHGMPYALAPKEQTHVPMLLWLSPSYARSSGIDTGCLASTKNEPRSHDNLFHTILGMLDIDTKVYVPDLNILASCRAATASSQMDSMQQARSK